MDKSVLFLKKIIFSNFIATNFSVNPMGASFIFKTLLFKKFMCTGIWL